MHVMLDLETMSTRHDAAVVSIGAVKFDPYARPGTEIIDGCEVVIDLQSCAGFGLHLDGDTVTWWLQQSDAARQSLCAPERQGIYEALVAFKAWFGSDSLPTWGNGAGFDCVILRNAYRKVLGDHPPFRYSDERCYRTLNKLVPLEFVPPTIPHNALEDARAQAVHLQKIIQQLNLKGEGNGN